MLAEQVPDKNTLSKISAFMQINSIHELKGLMKDGSEEFAAYKEIAKVLYTLKIMGVGDFCVYDPSIVRGLAYYTGIVFEVHDAGSDLRAICGGGRYDNLLRDFGGPTISATGMGMGDCVLEILLREKGLLDKQVPKRHLEYFVISLGGIDEQADEEVYRIIAKLRLLGYSANFSYKSGGLSKQLKEASAQNAKKCIIIGEEFENKQLVIKDMASGEQKLVNYDEFLSGLDSG
jgi:histidyl-tRNA synthetase